MSVKAYGHSYHSAQKINYKPRELEARALLEAARRLSAALENSDNRALMDQAIDFHWRLWTLFQNDAKSEDFTFPMDVRVTILEIARYMDSSIFKFFGNRKENMHHIKHFIEINRTIAQGLLDQLSRETDHSTQNPPENKGKIEVSS